MSKILRKEQIESAYVKWFKENGHKYCIIDGFTTFKAAFTILMPIIDKQDEIIKELLEVAEVHLDDTMEKIQETQQILNQITQNDNTKIV